VTDAASVVTAFPRPSPSRNVTAVGKLTLAMK
jgi:hypothetical protein